MEILNKRCPCQMKTRLLKKAGFGVSEIGFGCMSLGEDHSINERLIHNAIDSGINYFDTADLYQKGFNEETLGKALKGKRDEVIIATKVGNEWNIDGTSWRWNPRKSYILKAVDQSLKRLKIDYIDIYQLHGGTIDDPIEEVVEAFELLKQKGKIRHYGLSSIRPNVVNAFLQYSGLVSDMLQYSLLDRRPEEQLMPLLVETETGVMVRGVLAKGLLAGKGISNYLNYIFQIVEKQLDKLISFSNEKMSIAGLSLQWVLSNSYVTSAVIGFRTQDQFNGLLKQYSGKPMDPEVYEALSSVVEVNRYQSHRIE
jgi:aryl-alcohol dehydrogenase-like predicted oxidoreductase